MGSNRFQVFVPALALALIAPQCGPHVHEVTIGDLHIAFWRDYEEGRVDRTHFRYAFAVEVTNNGDTAIPSLDLEVTSTSPTSEVDTFAGANLVAFESIAPGESHESYFALIQDRTVPFDPSALSFIPETYPYEGRARAFEIVEASAPSGTAITVLGEKFRRSTRAKVCDSFSCLDAPVERVSAGVALVGVPFNTYGEPAENGALLAPLPASQVEVFFYNNAAGNLEFETTDLPESLEPPGAVIARELSTLVEEVAILDADPEGLREAATALGDPSVIEQAAALSESEQRGHTTPRGAYSIEADSKHANDPRHPEVLRSLANARLSAHDLVTNLLSPSCHRTRSQSPLHLFHLQCR